jgi:t-SNARE complex subunit (syntaxin)
MAKAKVNVIYEQRHVISDKEELVFELFRWRSEYRTTYELEVYKVTQLTKNEILPILNRYDFQNISQKLIVADSDGEAINAAVEIYNRYERIHKIHKLVGHVANYCVEDENG